MAVITISSGSFCNGEKVAEKVAKQLGYRMISNEVVRIASEKFQVPEPKLYMAIHDSSLILERFTKEKQRYISYVESAVLAQFKTNNLVYHGLGGQFFGYHVPQLLKVRIAANLEDRIALMMQQENLSKKQAAYLLKKEDRKRRSWSRQFYRRDNQDITLYDLVIQVHQLNIDNAVDIICQTVSQPQFQTTPETQQEMENMALSAEIKAVLIAEYPVYGVIANGQKVEVYVRYTLHSDAMLSEKITAKVLQIPGISSVSVTLIPGVLFA